MHAPATRAGDENDDLLTVVAQIRARNTRENMPVPAPAAVAAVLSHLRDEVPMSAAELVEDERQRHALEEELLAVERADAHQDRLL